MEVKLTGPKTLKLQSQQVAYILDTLTTRPFREVNGLINEIMLQLKIQETENETSDSSHSSSAGPNGVSGTGPADR